MIDLQAFLWALFGGHVMVLIFILLSLGIAWLIDILCDWRNNKWK